MLALIALVISAIAWAFQAFGDGLDDPWVWLFAALVFLAAHLFYPIGIPVDRWRNR